MCAQGQLGAVTGSIFDTSGAVVPEAEITITNMNTRVKSMAKASSAGYYRVPVPPGKYQVEAPKTGFEVSVAKDIVVPVAQVVTVDLTLKIGSTTQTVTVTSEAPLLTTSTAEVGAAITPQEFQTLPVILSDGGRPLDAFVWESSARHHAGLEWQAIDQRWPRLEPPHPHRRRQHRPLRLGQHGRVPARGGFRR